MRLNYVAMLLITFLLIFGLSCVRCQSMLDTDEICNDSEWRCANGSCITLGKRCDGHADCADASDESFVTCRQNSCPADAFRCAYGACVNGSAPCNSKQDCFDNSDEALTRCLPETARTQCDMTTLSDGKVLFSCFIRTDCENGQLLDVADRCDGKVDCTDGSDETIARCTETKCGEDTFRCAYGGCAHKYAQCNGIVDCADGSDESDGLCGRVPTPKPPIDVTTTAPTLSSCVLPPYPEHGTYSVPGKSLEPGEIQDHIYVNYTCTPPYKIVGRNFLSCNQGVWSGEFPSCKLYCKLDKHVSVEYRCLFSGSRSLQGSRVCGNEEPSGVTVKPVCLTPNYYYPGVLPFMRCVEGTWDSIATCIPECGRTTPTGMKLVAGGSQAARDELPWHTGIYIKEPYRQICGGTVLTTAVVLSAAHCFWVNEAPQPAQNYAVAVGKLHIEWEHTNDTDAQTSDVLDIKIPARFQGRISSFQDDIALLLLTTPLRYTVHVRPACLDFDYEFDSRQLRDGNIGKVAGWGLTSERGGPSPTLKVVELPYVPVERCLNESLFDFRGYITSDKICAGYTNGTAVCRGDSGGGLTFPDVERGVTRHFLRGIVSTAPRGDHECNVDAVTTFTRVVKHHHFIRRHLIGL